MTTKKRSEKKRRKYYQEHKEQFKQYKQKKEVKEKIKKRSADYYQKNKKRLQAYYARKGKCEHCNKEVIVQHIKKHQLTPACQLKRMMNEEVIKQYEIIKKLHKLRAEIKELRGY